MKFNARKASLALPGVTGTARVGRPTSAVLARLQPGDIAVIDHPDLDRQTATALVDAGVRVVVNAASMTPGRYTNLGPEVLAEAGVLLVDQVDRRAMDRIADGQQVRVHDGVVHAVGSDGRGEQLATGRTVELDTPAGAGGEQSRESLPTRLDALTRSAADFARLEPSLLLHGRGLPALTTALAGRPAVVVGTPDHAELQAVASFVREQAPAVVAIGAAADDLLGLSWAPDVVVVTAGDPATVPSPDALRLATDVVLVAERGSGLAEQATIEAVAGAPLVVETSAGAEDVALLLTDRGGASVVVGVGLRARLEGLLDGEGELDAGSFATRLKLGDRLVDAAAVRALCTGRPGAGQVVAVFAAGLVALLAAISVTPVGQGWAHDLLDYLGGLT